MKIKIDKADTTFSRYVRIRDGQCVRCKSSVEFNIDGDPVSHQCSHFWGRGRFTTREDPENCDTLCYPCHQLWGGDLRREYENFKIKQLGQKGFDALMIKAHQVGKKDRKLSYLIAKKLYEEEKAKKNS